MKKIGMCMSLVCVVSMQASEKKSGKEDIKTRDRLRTALRKEHEDFRKTHGTDFVKGLEAKRTKMHSEQSVTEDKK